MKLGYPIKKYKLLKLVESGFTSPDMNVGYMNQVWNMNSDVYISRILMIKPLILRHWK